MDREEMLGNQRIILKGDGWSFGIEFFVQLALFEKTGYGDWTIITLYKGSRHNWTDGEIDIYYYAFRVSSEKYHMGIELISYIDLILPFQINASGYSYQSVYKEAIKNILEPKEIKLDCPPEKMMGEIKKYIQSL